MTIIFFFQAEDGIRDYKVTGVQTCALPISSVRCRQDAARAGHARLDPPRTGRRCRVGLPPPSGEGPQRTRLGPFPARSEERRVGKEWRSRRWAWHLSENKESM